MRIGLIFGGKSTEHVVSVLSATNIERELVALGHTVLPLFVDTSGRWYEVLKDPKQPLKKSLDRLRPIHLNLTTFEPFNEMDLIFPVIHGTFGEDGGLQGFLRLLDIPFTGPDVMNFAIGMDKEITKRLLKTGGFKVADYVCLTKGDVYDVDAIIQEFQLPCFVKPACLGSSIAVTKAKTRDQLVEGIEHAFAHDRKILVERYIDGIDVECGVIGTSNPIASLPIALYTTHEFYDYEAKYFDKDGLYTEAPMKISQELTDEIMYLSRCVYKFLRCHSMARIDYLMTKDGQFYVNEINTIPGFTDSSGFPVAFEVSGYSYPRLLSYLIEDAIAYHQEGKALKVLSPNVKQYV